LSVRTQINNTTVNASLQADTQSTSFSQSSLLLQCRYSLIGACTKRFPHTVISTHNDTKIAPFHIASSFHALRSALSPSVAAPLPAAFCTSGAASQFLVSHTVHSRGWNRRLSASVVVDEPSGERVQGLQAAAGEPPGEGESRRGDAPSAMGQRREAVRAHVLACVGDCDLGRGCVVWNRLVDQRRESLEGLESHGRD